ERAPAQLLRRRRSGEEQSEDEKTKGASHPIWDFGFWILDWARLATGTTKRIEVSRGENAAILLSTSPADRPARCTSSHRNGTPSCARKGFFGKTAQSEPSLSMRVSRSRKNAESEPSPGTSTIIHGCLPEGIRSTRSTSGPKICRMVRMNSREEPWAYAGQS